MIDIRGDYELQPIYKNHNNKTYKGFETELKSVNDSRVKDLSVTDDGESLNSVWKCNNLWARLKFFFKGELTVRILGKRHPGIAIVIGDIFDDQ